MSMKRLWTIFKARNYEFFRDRAAFGWNFLFPFLIVAGFVLTTCTALNVKRTRPVSDVF